MLVQFQVKTRGEDAPNEPGSFFNGYRYQAMVFVGNVAELVRVGERDENAFIVERPGMVGACESLCDAAFLYLSSQDGARSEEHTSELQSLMRISYAVFCLKKKTTSTTHLPPK